MLEPSVHNRACANYLTRRMPEHPESFPANALVPIKRRTLRDPHHGQPPLEAASHTGRAETTRSLDIVFSYITVPPHATGDPPRSMDLA